MRTKGLSCYKSGFYRFLKRAKIRRMSSKEVIENQCI